MFWSFWLLVIHYNIYMEFLAFRMVETLGYSINNDSYRNATHNSILSEGYAWSIPCTSDSILVF